MPGDEQAPADGSNPWAVVEVSFGELGTKVEYTNRAESCYEDTED